MNRNLLASAALFLTSYCAYAQQPSQDTRVQDKRIYFHPDHPPRRALIKCDLLFYPNPAIGETGVHVENMPDELAGSSYQLAVFKMNGQQVQTCEWTAGEKLDVSHLAEGMYIVTVRRGELMFSQKLVVKK